MGGLYQPAPGYALNPALPQLPPNPSAWNNVQPIGLTPFSMGKSDMARQNLQNVQQQGNQFLYGFGQQANAAFGGADQYGNLISSLYSPIWQGGGGYTPQMISDIQAQQGLSDIQSGLNNAYLTPDEQSAMAGNPYAAYNSFAPYQQAGTQIAADSAQAINAPITGAQRTFGDISNQYQTQMAGAVANPGLRVGPQYYGAVQRGLDTGRGAISDPGLNVTGQYLQQAGMTDQEVQQAAETGARTAAAPFQNATRQMYADAAASGITDARGLAASAAALARGQAAEESSGATNALLAARAEQAARATGVQQTQLGAAGARAGFGLQYSGEQIGAANAAQQMELGANQYITGAQMNAAQGAANLGTGQTQYLTSADIAAQQDIANRGLAVNQYNANMATGLQTAAEQAAAARAGTIATNRQGISQFNTGVNMGINQAQSGRAIASYAPWVSAQQEGRGAAVGQQGYYGGQGLAAQGLGQQAWNTQNQYTSVPINQQIAAQQVNNATGPMAWFNTITGALGAGASAYTGGGGKW